MPTSPISPRLLATAAHMALALSVVILAAPGQARAQPTPLVGLNSYVESGMRDWEVPGLAIAVVQGDSVVFTRGYGVRALGGSEPVDEHTLFAIASTTKAFTSAALGILQDEGQLDLDDPVHRHLPEFRLGDPYVSSAFTVRDLLTHRSGLARHDQLWISAPFDRAEILRRAVHLPAAGRFRADYGYHNIMYIAAGEVVGAASGSTWDRFVQERLFDPLGMTRSTTRSEVVDTRDNVATAHSRVGGDIVRMPRRNYDNIGGAGAAWSSVTDMARWIRLHLGEGTFEGRRILDAATAREMHTPQTLIPVDSITERLFPGAYFRSYGLGWNVHDYQGVKLVHHTGSINWTRTHVAMIPELDVGVVVIANLSSSNLQQAIVYRVLDAFLGAEPRDWSAEYLALARRSDERGAASRREVEEGRVAGTSPSLSLDRFAGTYISDLYGEIHVLRESDGLTLRYSDEYVGDMQHWHHDTFQAVWRQTGFGSAFVSFALDARARPARMHVDGLGEFRRTRSEPADEEL